MTGGRRSAALAAALAVAAGAASAQGRAHEHGVATLDVAVDARQVSITLDSPLDNLVGFERAPRSDDERRQAAAAVARLEAGAQLFRIDPAAQCRLAGVELDAPVLGLGSAGPQAERPHASVEARYAFDCADATKAAYIDHALFDFARLQRVRVQLALPKGQSARELKRPAGRLALAPPK